MDEGSKSLYHLSNYSLVLQHILCTMKVTSGTFQSYLSYDWSFTCSDTFSEEKAYRHVPVD